MLMHQEDRHPAPNCGGRVRAAVGATDGRLGRAAQVSPRVHDGRLQEPDVATS